MTVKNVEMGVPIDRGLTQLDLLKKRLFFFVEMGVPIDRGLTHGVSSNSYFATSPRRNGCPDR